MAMMLSEMNGLWQMRQVEVASYACCSPLVRGSVIRSYTPTGHPRLSSREPTAFSLQCRKNLESQSLKEHLRYIAMQYGTCSQILVVYDELSDGEAVCSLKVAIVREWNGKLFIIVFTVPSKVSGIRLVVGNLVTIWVQ